MSSRAKPEIIDISPVVSPAAAVWPGDVIFGYRESLSIEQGDPVTLGSVTTTLHVGAHADAPRHYARGGADMAGRSLDLYLGPCVVVDAAVGSGMRLLPGQVGWPLGADRVLFKTGSYRDPRRFTRDFAALSPELIDAVADGGGRLIGIDTPSIDLFEDRALEAHGAAARHDMAILEGLMLDHVEPGCYRLVALPLRLAGADASPVRAVLLRP